MVLKYLVAQDTMLPTLACLPVLCALKASTQLPMELLNVNRVQYRTNAHYLMLNLYLVGVGNTNLSLVKDTVCLCQLALLLIRMELLFYAR